ncbi:MAG: hypothetical protein ABIJ09_02230 [Pseudomonadota bacterium]
MATRVNSTPPPRPAPVSNPAAGSSASSPAAVPRTGLGGLLGNVANTVRDAVERATRAQDPAVVQNLEQNSTQNNAATLAKPPAKGLTNGDPASTTAPAAPTAPNGAAAAAASTGTPQVVSNVDFSKMTQDQQYDYLQKMSQEKAGNAASWKTGDKELNLVGVRSFSNGAANAGEADKYNDTVYACRMNNGKKEVYAFDASVDGGVWDKNNAAYQDMAVKDRQGNAMGITHMADGHYQDAFTRGAVSGSDMGLRQDGWVRAHVDRNNDGKISNNEKLGFQGKGRVAGADMQFQFHPGYGENVGQNSAGCQAIKGEQWDKFQSLLKEAPESQKNFSYTLADSKNLKSYDEQMKYQPVTGWAALGKMDPINFYNGMTAHSNTSTVGSTNIGAEGRGLVSSDDQNALTAIQDSSSDAKVEGTGGNNGIGIVRTPYQPLTFTWPWKW